MGLSRFSARDARAVPDFIYELFPVLREMKQRRGATSPAASSSNWRSAAPWPASRDC